MTRDVLVTISGLQTDVVPREDTEDEPIEVVTPASYFYKNGKHYLIYEEVTEGFPGVTKNKIKVTDENTIEILKSGNVNTHMLFCKGKDSMTYYDTPYGKMLVGIHTTEVQVEETENFIRILIEYGLDVNHDPIADCEIRITVQSKEVKEFPVTETDWQ